MSNTHLVDLSVELSNILPKEWLVKLSEHNNGWGKVTPIRISSPEINPKTGSNLICLIYVDPKKLDIHCHDVSSPEVLLLRLKLRESMKAKLIRTFMLSYLECSIGCETCRESAPFYESIS